MNNLIVNKILTYKELADEKQPIIRVELNDGNCLRVFI